MTKKRGYLTSYEYDKDDRVTKVAFDDVNRRDKTIPHGWKHSGLQWVYEKTIESATEKKNYYVWADGTGWPWCATRWTGTGWSLRMTAVGE